ncbi:diaminopimelate epimerase [Sphingomicrobium nitratireducens]|uniref:diaminopimelate epimerase n=1 Tax=Sphingomicrobium nitratireducens TaxID=2964666 RepID=UPI002240D264|nr:diaminopimelate epimerase [Sphingomicrobium nitratireducens]
MATTFHKMHGLGNDFVILDAREEAIEVDGTLARRLCDRRHGIGCDQLIRLSNGGERMRMDIWNADGSSASACGNAARCVIALTGETAIDTAGGPIEGEALEGTVRVEMGEPRFEWNEIPLADPFPTNPLPLAWDELEAPDAVNVGNPHLVFFVDKPGKVPLGEIGPQIEVDPAFPERINVNVAKVTAKGLKIRTFERGAGLTLACGTGACASAVAAIRRGLVSSPVRVKMPGGVLHISWSPGEPIVMEGPATHVFTGKIDLETLR